MKARPQTYLVLDIETTGVSVVEDEIIEIGAIVVNGGTIDKEFQSLVKVSKKIPASIESLTGITDQLIDKNGRELLEVLSEFVEFASDLLVVSHNVEFDYGFLRAACKRFDLPLFSNQCIDTLVLARRLVDDVKNYKLTTLLDYFKIEVKGRHRSIEDCLATKQLYEKLIKVEQKEI
ncbi:MAG: DNA polymerase III PolC-type [Syntrophomonadaceae bacterium]|nr:DNA polymerase III PolC-type [Bacillota bacterium]